MSAELQEYKTQPHTPELVTGTHRAIWWVRGEVVGMIIEVPPCPYTQEELAQLEREGRRVGFLPPELATQQSRHILGRMFPEMQSRSVTKGNSVTNDEDPSGWFDYEAAVDAPYLGTNEEELIDRIAKAGRKILSLNQYIVAGQDSKLLTSHYLDVRTFVRLGSRDGRLVVLASFGADGHLNVIWDLHPLRRHSLLGGRSAGVKRT